MSMPYLWVGLGGFFGASSRYFMGRLLQSQVGFPFATLFVNVVGSFLIGVLSVWLFQRSQFGDELRLLLMVGFLGSFTTFSAFSLETLALIQAGHLLKAFVNVASNIALSLIAVWLGYCVVRQVA